MTDAEIIQLGSRGRPGRGSRSAPSAAARGLASPRPARSSAAARAAAAAADEPETILDRAATPGPDAARTPGPDAARTPGPDPREQSSDQHPDQATGSPPPYPGSSEPIDEPKSFNLPPTLDLAALLAEFASVAAHVLQRLRSAPIEQLRDITADPLRGVLRLAGALGVDWQGSLDDVVEFARSRLHGDYSIDDFGFDPEFTTKVFLPLLRPLVQNWFRVEVRGLENIPESGAALLVCNHAGTFPLDGMVLHSVVHDELARHVRMLGADLIFATPYAHDLARKTGVTLACQEDAERLLESEQLVAVFPEGFKGLGKPYADRYKLQRFGRGGFVSAAVRAQVPIIPVAIVGSEEIYPMMSGAPALARALGLPYFPITPLFPWLGALGMIPLPSKWVIQFGDAIATDELPPGAADDPMVVFNVTDQVRETIQHTLYALLMQRRSAFL
ncbi:MAG TPA: lysophospholipid acyltransferase family protein [Propionibacteriaceae bacterium]|nr:lysophospholipid acyltransferase family protein [Propionibacteriaceae bacterium]